MRAGLALLAVLGAAGCAGVTGPPAPVRPTVLVYGDSVVRESFPMLAFELNAVLPGYQAVDNSFPGTALCDWLPNMAGPDNRPGVRLVILAYSGNDQTPCVDGHDYTTTWFLSYETALSEWTTRGVHVIVVGGPGPVGTTPTTPDLSTTHRQIAEGVASQYPARYVDASTPFLDGTGTYASALPCLPGGEPTCQPNGLVQVRAPDGVHLCDELVIPCPGYSSGVFRWARQIAAGAIGDG